MALVHTYSKPIVVTSANYAHNTRPIVVRVSAVTPTSFCVHLKNPSSLPPAPENVSYLVVEAGVWTIGGVKIEARSYSSTVTDYDGSWVGQPQTYGQTYTNPVVLGQVMTENDDWSVFWAQGSTRSSAPSATRLVTGKMVGEDSNAIRIAETVGVIVIEAGHGTLAGVEFEARVGANTVAGIDDAPPFFYTFTRAFTGVPTVAVVGLAGMRGANGGWAQTHGATPTTTTRMSLSVDEDQLMDAERSHIAEQVAYVVFLTPGK